MLTQIVCSHCVRILAVHQHGELTHGRNRLASPVLTLIVMVVFEVMVVF